MGERRAGVPRDEGVIIRGTYAEGAWGLLPVIWDHNVIVPRALAEASFLRPEY